MHRQGLLNPARTLSFLWGDEITSTRRYVQEKKGSKIVAGLSLDMVGQNTELTGGTFLIEKMPDPSAIWTRGEDKHTEWGAGDVGKDDLFPHFMNDYTWQLTQQQAETSGWQVAQNPFEGGSDHVPFLMGKIPAVLFWHFTDQFYHTDGDTMDKVSPETMRNVGLTALRTGIGLAEGSTKLAEEVLQQLRQAAKQRIEAEAKLSTAAIAAGAAGGTELQKEIISSWGEWYRAAMATIVEIPATGATIEMNQQITAAQQELQEQVEQVLEQL